MLNKKIAGRLTKAEVDKKVRGWKGASDHAPVWIELADEDFPKRKIASQKAETLEIQIEKAGTVEAITTQTIADIKNLLRPHLNQRFHQISNP